VLKIMVSSLKGNPPERQSNRECEGNFLDCSR